MLQIRQTSDVTLNVRCYVKRWMLRQTSDVVSNVTLTYLPWRMM